MTTLIALGARRTLREIAAVIRRRGWATSDGCGLGGAMCVPCAAELVRWPSFILPFIYQHGIDRCRTESQALSMLERD